MQDGLQKVEGTDWALEQLQLSSITCLRMGMFALCRARQWLSLDPKVHPRFIATPWLMPGPVNRIIPCAGCPLSIQLAGLSSDIYPPWRKRWAPGTAQGSSGVPALEERSSHAFSEALTEFGSVCQGALWHGLNPLQNHVLCKEQKFRFEQAHAYVKLYSSLPSQWVLFLTQVLFTHKLFFFQIFHEILIGPTLDLRISSFPWPAKVHSAILGLEEARIYPGMFLLHFHCRPCNVTLFQP